MGREMEPQPPSSRWCRPSSACHGTPAVDVPFYRQIIVFGEQKEHTLAMVADTHTQRVLDLVHQKGLLRTSDLDAIEAPRVVLTRLTSAGLLDKVGRGLYRLPSHTGSEHEGLAVVATKVPQAVFCLLTALQFHELTTQLPRQVWIAMPRGSHVPRLDYPPIKMVQMTDDVYAAGVEEHQRDGVMLRVRCGQDGRGLLQTPQQDRTGRGAGGAEGCTRQAKGHGG